jgi:pilus assembly protein CpaF
MSAAAGLLFDVDVGGPGLAPTIDPVAELTPFGGLDRWLDDASVTDLMVNGGSVWIDRGSGMSLVGRISSEALAAALERMLAPVGRRLDRSRPTVDARLPDGSRLCAVVNPVAVDGTCVAIRRFPEARLGVEAFLRAGGGAFAIGPESSLLELLHRLVHARCNVLVSGATSSGKTTLLGGMAALVPRTERLLTLEDTAELRIDHPHVVRFECRAASPDGAAGVGLDELVRTALRMRPDRLIVGEVRGAEAADLLQALNTGHDGSLSTIHANGTLDALHRLAMLVSSSSPAWPAAAVAALVARAVDVVIHVERGVDGRRAVVAVDEVARPEEFDGAGRGLSATAGFATRSLWPGRVPLGRGRAT